MMRSFITRSFTKYYQRDQIEEDEMGGARSTHGRDEKLIRVFSLESPKRPVGRPRRRW
jgi:hypothetical protein